VLRWGVEKKKKMSERDAEELAKVRYQDMMVMAPPEKYKVVDLDEFGKDMRCSLHTPSIHSSPAICRHPQPGCT